MSKKIKSEKKALVPRLRFPEYLDAGEWHKTQLGELGEFLGGGTPSKKNNSFWEGSIPWVSSSDISEESIHDIEITRFITEEAVERSATRLVPEDSILLVSRVGIGKLALTRSAICTSQDFTNLTPHTGNLEFLGYFLKANKHALENLSQGMAIKGYTKEDVSKFIIHLPKLEEQQKIADCLSSLDALIAAQADKIDALKIHKKGLMQQLFPREGETVPRLRFPEFRNARAWEEKVLPNVCQINPRRMPMDEKTLVSFVPMSSVSESGQLENPEVRSYGEVKTGYTSFVNNDVIIAKITPCFENGKAAHIQNLINGVGFGSTEFHVFRAKDTCLPQFLFAQLYRESVRSRGVDSMIGNAGQRRVPKNFFEKLPFFLPSIAEQQAVANCLSTLDDCIAIKADRIEMLKWHKKGLLQQLFPKMEIIKT